MSGFVWYSFGSDSTGPKLAKALGFGSGKKTPRPQDHSIIIGWGCKAGEKYDPIQFQQAISSGALRVLNTPDALANVRNKRQMLALLQSRKVSVPGMVAPGAVTGNVFGQQVRAALESGVLAFPLVGMRESHKGEPSFFYTEGELGQGIDRMLAEGDGPFYMRSLCPGEEYRVHVFRDMAILAQVKTPAKDPEAALIEDLKEKLYKRAEKAGLGAAPGQKLGMDFAIKELAPEILRGPSQLLRSVSKGWTLQDCDLNKVPEHAVMEAITALDAAGLDLGAVSLTVDGKVARVTNITSAPGLSDEHLAIYVAALRDFCTAKAPKGRKEAAAKGEESAPAELLALLSRKVRGLSKAEVEAMLKTLD